MQPDGIPHVVGVVDKTKPPSAHNLQLLITVINPKGKIHCSQDAVIDLNLLRVPEQVSFMFLND